MALIEVLANLKGDPRLFPDSYRLTKIAVPDEVSRSVVDLEALGSDWRERLDVTRTAGDGWLIQRETALLAVPSAPSLESMNYLLNPLHGDAVLLLIFRTRSISTTGGFSMVHEDRHKYEYGLVTFHATFC